MKTRVEIKKDIDWKAVEALKKRVVGASYVKVGVPEGAKESDGTPLAMIAAVLEFGEPSLHINEMPFLRNTIRDNRRKYVRLNKQSLIGVLHGHITMEQALGRLGEVAAGHVRRFIASNTYVIKEKTIKRKGSSKALIDTGQLRTSITWEIAGVNVKHASELHRTLI